jgi:hypothetical protein
MSSTRLGIPHAHSIEERMEAREEAPRWGRRGKIERLLTVLLNAAEDVVNIIRKEPLRVEHGLDHARDRTEWHVLRMRMAVPLHTT